MKCNEINDFRFIMSIDMHNMMLEMLLLKQMRREYKHTKKELTLINAQINTLRLDFESEFHKLNKDKIKEFENLM